MNETMVKERIVEIGIDQGGKLFVRPEKLDFSFIYRAAMEVTWDPLRRALLSPRQGEEPSLILFKRILAAAADEYGVQLKIDPQTTLSNIPQRLQLQIEAEH